MGDKPQLIATARPGGPPLSSCPWQWLVPGGNFCADPAVARDGVISPQECSALSAVATGQQEG